MDGDNASNAYLRSTMKAYGLIKLVANEDINFLCSGHWALLIIDRSMHKGYICDSYNKDQKKTPDDFLVVKVLNEALQVNLDWTFPKCNQQRETWECGYYVMKWMCDFFMVIQQRFPDNIPTHFVSRKPIPMSLLDKMIYVENLHKWVVTEFILVGMGC
ncbi:ulp1 protease family, C-terminal catalytic domain-containing protein [Artemisia annua]|uniref:Ulp1 protease family, C-terminal catalytic domain-containing protein n=1 Tax=Artemisia annua TaxID=35608 RepID=A0A2U1QJ12_ARTAN|nr:ulp1 protease family, C-terminal catalytic domain-containing protein [Artemisia annua]